LSARCDGRLAALANLHVKTAYIDGELCGIDDAGLPSFTQTQAATGGARAKCGSSITLSISLHLADWDVSKLPLIERKALLEPLVANKPGLQFNGHDAGDGELILEHAGKLGLRRRLEDDRRALRAREPWLMAQSQSAPMPTRSMRISWRF
jgi:ATP-dependent DNA ligase